MFRDATTLVAAEAEILAAQHLESLRAVPTGHRSVFVRRIARVAAGVTGVLFAVVIIACLVASAWLPSPTSTCPCHGEPGSAAYDAAAVRLLFWSWPAMIAVYALAAVASSLVLRRRLRTHLARTADPFRDAAALRALDLVAVERSLSRRHGAASYAWPLLAITLLAPHTLHLLPFMSDVPPDGAALWMQVSGVVSVHVYLYGIFAAWTFPENGHVWRHVGWATGLSLFPGVLAYGLTSAIVLVTSAAVAVIGYLPMRAVMRRETEALNDAAPSAPWSLSTTWTASAGT